MKVSTHARYTAQAQLMFIATIEKLSGYKAAAVVALVKTKSDNGNLDLTVYFVTLHNEKCFMSFNELCLPVNWKKFAGFIPELRNSVAYTRSLAYQPISWKRGG